MPTLEAVLTSALLVLAPCIRAACMRAALQMMPPRVPGSPSPTLPTKVCLLCRWAVLWSEQEVSLLVVCRPALVPDVVLVMFVDATGASDSSDSSASGASGTAIIVAVAASVFVIVAVIAGLAL